MDSTPIHSHRGPTCFSPWRGISGTRARGRGQGRRHGRETRSPAGERRVRALDAPWSHTIWRRVESFGEAHGYCRRGTDGDFLIARLVDRPDDQPNPRLISRTSVLHVIARNHRQNGDRSQCAVWLLFRSSIATRGTCIGSLSRADDAPCARGGSWRSVIDPKEIGEEETIKCERRSKEEKLKELFLRESSDNRDRGKCRPYLVSSV